MKTNRIVICLVVVVLLASAVVAALAGDDVAQHRSCSNCGMDRKLYGYSRVLIRYLDGTEIGACSLHCAVIELNENKDRKLKSLLVADRDTQVLIPAETAHWVIGGKKRGVMTERPKWAFATKAAAEKFIGAYCGEIANWEKALAEAQEDAAPMPHR